MPFGLLSKIFLGSSLGIEYDRPAPSCSISKASEVIRSPDQTSAGGTCDALLTKYRVLRAIDAYFVSLSLAFFA